MPNSNGNSRALLGLVGILATLLIFTVGYIFNQRTAYGELGEIQSQVNANVRQMERNDIRITGINDNIVEIKERLNKIDTTMNEMYKMMINLDRKTNGN